MLSIARTRTFASTLTAPREAGLHRSFFQQPYRACRRASTKASFYYLSRLPEYLQNKPYYINLPPWAMPEGRNSNEESSVYHNIVVEDVRGRERNFTLDKNGFQIVKEAAYGEKSMVASLPWDRRFDSEFVQETVGPAVASFLEHMLDAERVIPFSFRTRRRDEQFPALPRGTDPAVPQPVQGVHVDFTPEYSMVVAERLCTNRNIPDLSSRRWQILSLWRPLFGPLQDWPLGVLDYTSLDVSGDLIASDNIYPEEVKENYNVFYNSSHRWFYISDHQPDELLLFKAHDTAEGKNVAKVCPHAAFEDPTAPPDARPRESVECLSLVLYPVGTA